MLTFASFYIIYKKFIIHNSYFFHTENLYSKKVIELSITFLYYLLYALLFLSTLIFSTPKIVSANIANIQFAICIPYVIPPVFTVIII